MIPEAQLCEWTFERRERGKAWGVDLSGEPEALLVDEVRRLRSCLHVAHVPDPGCDPCNCLDCLEHQKMLKDSYRRGRQ
jgi:hypothetical protein